MIKVLELNKLYIHKKSNRIVRCIGLSPYNECTWWYGETILPVMDPMFRIMHYDMDWLGGLIDWEEL